MSKFKTIDTIQNRFTEDFDIGDTGFVNDERIENSDQSAVRSVPSHLQKKIVERSRAFKKDGAIEPGTLVLVYSPQQSNSPTRANNEEMLAVLLDVQENDSQTWRGWLVSRDLEYASCWDLVLGPEDDPRDPLCQMIQAWNPVVIKRDAIQGILGSINSFRLACVRKLAHECESGQAPVEIGDTRPRVILARELSDGTGVVTGTSIGLDDFRKEFQSIYKNVAVSLSAAALQSHHVGRTKRWSSLIAIIMSAISFGALAMRFAMMSGMEAVRSDGTTITVGGHSRQIQKVPVLVAEPHTTMQAAVTEAARLGLDISVKSSEGGYDLLIDGLIPHSPEQTMLKETLGLSKSVGGELLFSIRHKP